VASPRSSAASVPKQSKPRRSSTRRDARLRSSTDARIPLRTKRATLLSGQADVPGAVTTDVLGINDAGQIVGRFGFGTGEPGFRFGFLNSGSSFTTIDFPGGARAIQANGIDAAGRIVGNYSEPEGIVSPCNLTESMDTGVGPACTNQASSLLHAYLLEGSSFTQLDFPGAIGTLGIGINDAGVIVGGFFDSTGTLHGYVANPVPEPSTWALTTIGALILLVYIRHDRLQIHRGRH